MINTTWLSTYLMLVETGHFTRTAERLNMTQPGVSQHIQKLEQQVGKPLLNRIGKRFELTEAGHMLAEYGRKSAQSEEAFFNAIQHDDPFRGNCRFACSGSLSMLLYPQFLTHQAQHPELTIRMEAAPNHRIIQSIKDNSVDLGIITAATHATDLTEKQIGTQPLCLVLPAERKSSRLPEYSELIEIGFINHPDGHHYAEQVLAANYMDAYRDMSDLSQHGAINQLGQILLPVSQGLGFTVLPEFAVRLFPHQDAIWIAPLPNPVSEALYLVHKRHRQLAKRYEWFVDKITEMTG